MTLGVRGKLFVASLTLILISDLAIEIYLENLLREWFDHRIVADMRRFAETAREMVEATYRGPHPLQLDPIADRLGRAMGKRVTIVGPGGRVLGDSELEESGLTEAENHAQRPEVMAATAHGMGISRRFSTTLRSDMLYVALPFHNAHGAGVVRVDMALYEIDKSIGRLRAMLLLAGVLGLSVAGVIAALASHMLTRTLRSLTRHAKLMAAGVRQPLTIQARDEISGLAGSFNTLVREMDEVVASLAMERSRLALVLEGMREGVVAVDEQGRINLANASVQHLLGLGAPPGGQALGAVLGQEPGGKLCSRIHARQPVSLLFQPSSPRAQAETILLHFTPFRDAPGGVAVMQDVSEHQRLETMRQEFVANVSHELRTPVTVLLGYLDTLLDETVDLPPATRGMVARLRANAIRLFHLVEELLDLSRLDAGREVMGCVSLPLLPEVRKVIPLLAERLMEKGITLALEIQAAPQVHADPRALSRILVNLLENAMKYTPEGGRIRILGRREGEGWFRLEVRDNGPGIPEQHRPYVFDRFYRVDKGRSRAMGGTGLGLAIVKSLMEAMGGTVGVDPVVPHGAAFWIRLPIVGDAASPPPQG